MYDEAALRSGGDGSFARAMGAQGATATWLGAAGSALGRRGDAVVEVMVVYVESRRAGPRGRSVALLPVCDERAAGRAPVWGGG